jgi:hypothetical protein
MTRPNYRSTQQELYTVCRLGWQSCTQYLGDFADFKARYNAGFIADRLAEVEAASNLPDDQARGSQSETLRIQLGQAAQDCLSGWQKLKRYIADAFPPEFQKAKLEAAGQNYYEKAGSNNWDSCRGLITSGNNFIALHLAELTANENMPPTFQTNFSNTKNTFEKLHQEFLKSEEAGSLSTENKLTANNNIYDKLISMYLDGQEIFKNNETIKKQFTFEQTLGLASGNNAAGIKGQITNSADGTPIANASIAIKDSNKIALTDAEGKYQLSPVPSGIYTIVITAEGFQPQEIVQQIKVGTVSGLSIQLTAIA